MVFRWFRVGARRGMARARSGEARGNRKIGKVYKLP